MLASRFYFLVFKLVLTREGRSGEYWPKVLAVRIEHRDGPYMKTIEGNIPQYG